MGRITLKHIANEFNVSIGTVSKCLNDSYEISSKTKEKIKNYAKLKNYKPNSIALRLRNKKTKTIGVVIPNILNSFFTKVFAGIEEVTTEKGYTLLSCISNESYLKEVKTMELLKNGTLDGIIISLSEETEKNQNFDHFKEIINEGIPIVLFDRVTQEIECDKVVVDDFEGAYKATKHLISKGCKRVAVVSIIDNLSVGKLRVNGYQKAINEEFYKEFVLRLDKKNEFYTVLGKFIKENKIDGLLCLEESSAVKSHKLLKELGYKIPDDISIISFTNGKLPRYVTPTITTISQHGLLIGQKAAKMLIKRLESEDKENFKTVVINTSLIERDSTRKTN